MNGVKLKRKIDQLLFNSFLNEDKKYTKNIMEILEMDGELKKLYLVINNFDVPPELPEEFITEFIEENIKMAKTIKMDSFNGLEKDLSDVELNESLDNAIYTLLFTDRSAINYADHVKSKKIVYEHIKSNGKQCLPLSDSLDENEKKSLNLFLSDPISFKNQLLDECLNKLDEQIDQTDDLATKVLIYETRDKLMTEKINCEQNPKDVIELLTLRNELLEIK